MSEWSRRDQGPIFWRHPLFSGLVFLIAAQKASASGFEPEILTFVACTEPRQAHISELRKDSRSSKLYLTKLTGSRKSTDERLFRSIGAEALVFSLPVFSGDVELADDVEVFLDGTIHKRKASFFERLLGGGRDRLFYRAQIGDRVTMLDAGSFTRLPIAICEKAWEG